MPQPDSPTMPSVSSGSTLKETSSTARTQACVRWSTPERIGKCLRSPRTESSGGAHTRISIASRSPSESRLNAIDVRKMATPGSAGTHAFT